MKVPADLSIRKPMKRNRVLKSLAELSSELLLAEVAGPEHTKPGQTEVATQETRQTPQPISVSTDSDAHGYQRWGINE
jgi:hypothetical protein